MNPAVRADRPTVPLAAGALLLAFMCGLPGASPASAQDAPPPRADIAAARELGHAILIARAAERRELESEIAPTLEALRELREALRLYATELRGEGTQTSARREERRDSAREALRALRVERQALAGKWARDAARGDATSGGSDMRAIRPEAFDAVEADIAAVVDEPVATGDAALAGRKAALDGLVERLAPPKVREDAQPLEPTFSFRDSRPPLASEAP